MFEEGSNSSSNRMRQETENEPQPRFEPETYIVVHHKVLPTEPSIPTQSSIVLLHLMGGFWCCNPVEHMHTTLAWCDGKFMQRLHHGSPLVFPLLLLYKEGRGNSHCWDQWLSGWNFTIESRSGFNPQLWIIFTLSPHLIRSRIR